MPPVVEEADLSKEGSFARSLRELAETLKKRLTYKSNSISPPGKIKLDQRVIIHLMRHAEAEHNLAHIHGRNRADYPDPELTKRGLKQCERAMAAFSHMDDITIILCSPLRRAMQTALFTFQPLYTRGLKLIPWSALREWGNGASNIESTIAELEKEMTGLPVDLRLLNEGWELETDAEDDGAERSNHVRKDLYELGEILQRGGTWKGIPMETNDGPVHIMIVSHGGFLANVMWADAALRNTGYTSLSFASEHQIAKGESKYRLFELADSQWA